MRPRWAAHPAAAALLLICFFLCLRRELFVVLDKEGGVEGGS